MPRRAGDDPSGLTRGGRVLGGLLVSFGFSFSWGFVCLGMHVKWQSPSLPPDERVSPPFPGR